MVVAVKVAVALRGRGTLLANVAVLLVLVVGMYHVGFNILRLQIGRQPFTVSIELPTSGGLYARSEVTYRGHLVGNVRDIRLRPGGVVADLRLDEGTKIPTDLDAVVAHLSAAGEQFVDLRPRTSSGPFLAAGDVIPLARTTVPVPTALLIRNVATLLDQVDSKDLNTVVDELALALGGTGPELARLVDRSDRLLAGLQQSLPSTLNVLRNGRRNLDTANDLSGQFADFNASLRTLSEQLKSSDPKVRKLLGAGPGGIAELDTFVATLTTPVAALLGNLVTPGSLVTARLPALNGLLIAFPEAFAALRTTVEDGDFRVDLHITDNPVCDYGGKRRSPIDPTRVAPNLNRFCSDTSAGVGARGAQNAPRSSPSGPGPSATSSARQGAAVSNPAAVSSVGTYDPASGYVALPDGTRLSLATSGGGPGVAIGQSWVALLLALLRS